jgi:hypothetical protein
MRNSESIEQVDYSLNEKFIRNALKIYFIPRDFVYFIQKFEPRLL